MSKYSKQLVKKIVNLIRSDSYTIPELCRLSGISESTYHSWKRTNLQFLQSIEGAKRDYDDKIVVAATRSLYKLIEGFYITEEKRIFDKSRNHGTDGAISPDVKTVILNTRYISPNLGAIIFVLTNRDPQNWRNTFRVEVTGKSGKDLLPARILNKQEAMKYLVEITDKQLEEKTADLEKKFNKSK